MDICYFDIQDWQEDGDIIMRHIPGIINYFNDLTKPLASPPCYGAPTPF